MISIITTVLIDTAEISAIVFLMMILVDFFDVHTRGSIKLFIRKSRWNAYFTTSFLGAIPGCFGSFINVSMYMHGFFGLGAISSGMIATSGDEAFIMLVRFPEKAVLLFIILFILAIPAGWLFDLLATKFSILKSHSACDLHEIHTEKKERDYKHYFKVHIWRHIFKKHIIRIIVWTFFSLLIINVLLEYFPISDFLKQNMTWIILLAALIGLIPESGPHIVFISLYAAGVIPFSVLLTSSISQDGHGVLPLLSYSFRDSIIIKVYNFFIALIIGWLAISLGL